ncbi:MAG: hypothetical protein HOV80_37555, partial [Polyangiaceae bacterium]|nr:hypothetical protein [Polyangiaceae bacterium]
MTASDPPHTDLELDAPPADPGPASARAEALAAALKLTRTAAQVLDRAGREPGESTDRWLDPKLAHLTAPTDMADRGTAASRIASAI